MQVSAGFLWLSDIHCETSTRRDLLKPPQSFIDFNTPNRESNIQGICDENDAVLGRGAYGVVFRASYKKRNVAVKVLEKSNGVKYESIKREANILNLVHPNIVRILKIVDCKNYGAIIMERFEGKSLQQVIDQEKIDLLHRLYILSDIAKALIFCHENGIVHSDLKPQNVLVALNSNNLADRPYSCKILDFGCSSKVDEMFLDSNIGGTVRYCAPEVLQNQLPDSSADIFSLAIIMWQLKECKIPYASIRANETIIWNVVKKDMRPDSRKVRLMNEEPLVLVKSRKTSQCKSESSFIYLRETVNLPFTPKLCNHKVPSIKLPKTSENLPLKSHLNGRRRLFNRKKLFNSYSSLSPNPDSEDENEDSNANMRDLFVDHQLYLRSPEKVLLVESKYVQMYRDCWHREKSQRLSAVKVFDSLQKFIDCL